MIYIAIALVQWSLSFAIYVNCNKGLPRNCIRQQFRRYLIAAILSSIPVAISKVYLWQPVMLLTMFTSVLWIITYPLLFHLGNRNSSTEYDNQIDPAFGIYLYGWLSGILVTIPCSVLPVTILEILLILIPFLQWGYCVIFSECVDINDMKTLQQTTKNEVIEFLASWKVRSLILNIILFSALLTWICIKNGFTVHLQEWWQLAISLAITLFVTFYLWRPKKGLYRRTGIIVLYDSVKEYISQNKKYRTEAENRIKALTVTPMAKPSEKPSTILLVLGESATRDYMSAFSSTDKDTTPWMRTMLEDTEHCIAFPNAYSCHVRTVQVLEKALTEFNQYDKGEFFASCSIIDIAHKLGMKVHWYSNQGYVGDVDTPVTLVANTADVAKWTLQEKRNKKTPYDEVLLDFLGEVDPDNNNLLVLHLKGNHFNFINRYPAEKRVWGSPDKIDGVTEYNNSLHYTDDVIRQFYEYGRKHLNMQAMIYMSDHGCTPTKSRRRDPHEFVNSRIPMMTWFSDEYIAEHPWRIEALKKNCNKYWTNDLFYELFCGVLDIKSEHFKEENSLASEQYRHTKETLTIMEGEIKLTEDKGAK